MEPFGVTIVKRGGCLYKAIVGKGKKSSSKEAPKQVGECPHEKLVALSSGSHKFICNFCGIKAGRREGKYSSSFQECSHNDLGFLEGGSHKFFCKYCGALVGLRNKEEPKSDTSRSQKIHFCSKCGALINGDTNFCQSCGTRIKKANEFQDINLRLLADNRKDPLLEHSIPKKSHDGFVGIILVVLLALVVGGIIIASHSSSSSSAASAESTGHWAQHCIGVWVPNPNYDPNWQSDGTGGQGGTSMPNVYQQQCSQAYVQGP